MPTYTYKSNEIILKLNNIIHQSDIKVYLIKFSKGDILIKVERKIILQFPNILVRTIINNNTSIIL